MTCDHIVLREQLSELYRGLEWLESEIKFQKADLEGYIKHDYGEGIDRCNHEIGNFLVYFIEGAIQLIQDEIDQIEAALHEA